ncbi:MAG: hypothetical protein ACPGRZ_17795 [Alphaproteobacteria bacterium]
MPALQYFVSTRASFVAQKTLYGYLKARMGTRYPSMFEDDVFVQSINIAKSHIYAACLSDLTIYTVAQAWADARVDETAYRKAALDCYARALSDNADELAEEFDVNASIETFTARLSQTDWNENALDRNNFTASPRALVKWAPIADAHKKYDVDIVDNSISFAWSEVRQNFLKRVDRDSMRLELEQAS